MCGLFIQDDIDREVAIAQYFLSRVDKLTKQQNGSDFYNADSFSIKHLNVVNLSHLTRPGLLSKYVNVLEVLRNELDYIDPDLIASHRQEATFHVRVLNEAGDFLSDDRNSSRTEIIGNNACHEPFAKTEEYNGINSGRSIGKRSARKAPIKYSGKLNEYDTDENNTNNTTVVDLNRSSNQPFRKKRCLSNECQTRREIVERLDDLEKDDADSIAMSTNESSSTVKIEKREARIWKDVNRKFKSMQAKVDKLEEKLLIKEVKLTESLKRKADQLKQKELQQKKQNEKLRKRVEQKKMKSDHRQLLSWNEQFEKLVRSYKENGHCGAAKGTQLCGWIRYQRTLYKHKSPILTPERIHMLESIGFEWAQRDQTPLETRVLEYIQLQENTVDGTQELDNEQLVLDWMKNKVVEYKSCLQPQEKSSRPDYDNTRFAERLTELAWVKEKGGSINDKQSILSVFPNNTGLILWAKTMRRQYKLLVDGKPSQLTQDRIGLLTDLGFDWFPRKHYAPPGSKKKAIKSDGTGHNLRAIPLDLNKTTGCNVAFLSGQEVKQPIIRNEDVSVDFEAMFR